MKGKLAELMVMVAPQIYQKYIMRNKKGEPVLYMKVQRAIYGMLKIALLFYKKTQIKIIQLTVKRGWEAFFGVITTN